MRKKEVSQIVPNSNPNFLRRSKPFITLKEKKLKIVSNLFNTSNESIINNTNNDILGDDSNEINNKAKDINEENIHDNSLAEQILNTPPINDTHRMSSNKNRFGKTYINSIPLKRILIPRSKSPIIQKHNHINLRNVNAFKNTSNTIIKSIKNKKEIFSSNDDFLHCRNCMIIIALNRYGKYFFNK